MACAQPDPAYAAACSEQTLTARRGFLSPLLAALPGLLDPATLQALADRDRFRACWAHPQLMEALSEVMSRVQPLYRGKDARVSRERRLQADALLAEHDAAVGPAGAADPAGGGPAEADRLERALALASEAVLRAPVADEEEATGDVGEASLALALWTRAGALRRTGRARAALVDMTRAREQRLPARLRPLYYWHLGHCYRDAGELSRAKVSYELAARLLGAAAADGALQRDLAALDHYRPQPSPTDHIKQAEIVVTGGAKPNMPALSKLVDVVEEEGKGRYLVAGAEGARAGAVLAVEAPYAACLLPDTRGTHCHHCFTRLSSCASEAAAWCARCAGAAWCSAACRAAAARYHSHECRWQDLLTGSGISVLSHIALRMVTQAGLARTLATHARHVARAAGEAALDAAALNDVEGTAKKSRLKTRKERLNRSKRGLKMTEKNPEEENSRHNADESDKNTAEDESEESMEALTAQVYSLCTHSEFRAPEDYLRRFAVAVFLLECLRKGNFFEECAPEQLDDSASRVCEVLVRNLQLLQFNAHEVFETVRGRHALRGARALPVGVALYPAAARANHECYPALARFFVGRRIVLATTRPLPAGGVVAECYGPHALRRPPAARRRALAARYWFHCACAACVAPDLYPMLADADDDLVALRCTRPECGGYVRARLPPEDAPPAAPAPPPPRPPSPCSACGDSPEPAALRDRLAIVAGCGRLFREGAQLMEAERVSEARALLCSALARLEAAQCAAPPRAAALAHEALRACLVHQGNTHRVPDHRDTADIDHPADPADPAELSL